MKFFSILLSLILSLICLIVGHNYLPATCEEPSKCSLCSATVGEALGHDYIGNICNNCGMKKDSTVKVYGAGETWKVPGQWEITINSVKNHYLCNEYLNKQEGYTNEQTVMVNYTYKNLGLEDGLFLCNLQMDFYDGNMETVNGYWCDHEISPQKCIIGAKHTANYIFVLNNKSNKMTISIELYDSNLNLQKAKFVVPIT